MRLTLLSLIAAFSASNSKSNTSFTTRLLRAEDVGALHTEAFETLADMYAIKKPANREDMMKDSGHIVASYCDEGDVDCVRNAYETTSEQFEASDFGPRNMIYPVEIDSKLIESMERVKCAVASMEKSGNIDNVVSELAEIKNEVEAMVDVNEGYKFAVLSAVSIASESSKLWDEVYNDPSHVLYGMHLSSYYSDNNGGRRLDEDDDYYGGINVVAIVVCDVMGGINAAVEIINDNIASVINPIKIISSALSAAVPASISCAFGEERSNERLR